MDPERTPLARSNDLIVEELGDEVLVYDLECDEAHCLSPAAARVWRACDGTTAVKELGPALGLESATIEDAIDQLSACELLESATRSLPSEGTTRRELTLRAVKVGAAAAAAPLILSAAAPPPAAAQTLAFCMQFSGPDCGTGDPSQGCKAAGCCCCTPPASGGFFICSNDISGCNANANQCNV